jgi:hypothetical protein
MSYPPNTAHHVDDTTGHGGLVVGHDEGTPTQTDDFASTSLLLGLCAFSEEVLLSLEIKSALKKQGVHETEMPEYFQCLQELAGIVSTTRPTTEALPTALQHSLEKPELEEAMGTLKDYLWDAAGACWDSERALALAQCACSVNQRSKNPRNYFLIDPKNLHHSVYHKALRGLRSALETIL